MNTEFCAPVADSVRYKHYCEKKTGELTNLIRNFLFIPDKHLSWCNVILVRHNGIFFPSKSKDLIQLFAGVHWYTDMMQSIIWKRIHILTVWTWRKYRDLKFQLLRVNKKVEKIRGCKAGQVLTLYKIFNNTQSVLDTGQQRGEKISVYTSGAF